MSDRPPGRIKQRPEDFVVEEIPAYEPVGQGSHVFVRFVGSVLQSKLLTSISLKLT